MFLLLQQVSERYKDNLPNKKLLSDLKFLKIEIISEY